MTPAETRGFLTAGFPLPFAGLTFAGRGARILGIGWRRGLASDVKNLLFFSEKER